MNIHSLSIFVLFFSFICFSCKENLSPDLQKVADQKAAYDANPSKETAAGYFAAVSLYSGVHPREQETKDLLIEASNIAKKEGQNLMAASMSNELIKQFPDDLENKTRLVELANTMQSAGKREAASTLKYFVTKKYPKFAAENGVVLPGGMPESVDTLIKMKYDKIFEESAATGLNRQASFQYVDAVEAYAMVFPENDQSPEYLIQAAEVSRTLQTFKKSLGLYDWIISRYPENKNAPNAMFLKGFTLDDNLKNIEAAKEVYNLFLERYPTHELAGAAQFSLNNLGKSDEEIQQELERLQRENAG